MGSGVVLLVLVSASEALFLVRGHEERRRKGKTRHDRNPRAHLSLLLSSTQGRYPSPFSLPSTLTRACRLRMVTFGLLRYVHLLRISSFREVDADLFSLFLLARRSPSSSSPSSSEPSRMHSLPCKSSELVRTTQQLSRRRGLPSSRRRLRTRGLL